MSVPRIDTPAEELAWERVAECHAALGGSLCVAGRQVSILGHGLRVLATIPWDADDPVASADALCACVAWLARMGPREAA